ncbi:MAG: diguanylate cyclase, partial [Clostridia bacterium]|nr:diguanylate cyclase [Clostridia bacterium]
AKNQPLTLIYADLDDFKAYNDHYGFQRGDQAIRFTAEVITACAQRQGEKDIFIGHIGGDDFVIITASDKVQQLCDAIIANFDSRVEELYDEEDARRGYIKNVDRLGHEVIVPLLSLSLAVVESKGQFRTRLEIAEVAAELKRYAKSRRGSLTVRDRRRTYQLRRSTSK